MGQDATNQLQNPAPAELLEMIWPETGMHVTVEVTGAAKDTLDETGAIDLSVDFVTLSLSPLEFIQLASAMRMSVDNLLDLHPKYQKDVINAFDIRD